jgi:CHAD domain-containing protein
MTSADGQELEIEAKLRITNPGGLTALLDGGSLGQWQLGPPQQLQLRDQYFDTADWRIYRAGFALRLRSGEGDPQLFLKGLTSGDVVSKRREISQQLRSPRLPRRLPPGPVADILDRVVGSARLTRLFTIRTTRIGRVVQADSSSVAQLAFDTTTVAVGNRQRGPAAQMLEIERFDGGTEADVQGLAEMFVDACGLEPDSRSKFEHGLTVAGLDPSAFMSFGQEQFGADSSCREAASAVLRRQMRRMLKAEGPTRLDEDIEALHDMRVAVRRARTYLRIFADCLPLRSTSRLRRELRWLGDKLGAVRDLDVQLAGLEASGAGQSAYQAYKDYLLKLRRPRRRQLLAALNSRRYERLLAAARRLLKGRSVLPRHQEQRSPFQETAPLLAGELLDKLVRRGKKLDADSPEGKLHRLRIHTKRFRYCLEASDALHGKSGKRAIEVAIALQDYLGELQNAVVSRQMLLDFGTRVASVRDRQVLLEVGALLGREDVSIASMKNGYPRAFKAFVRAKDIKRLARTLPLPGAIEPAPS